MNPAQAAATVAALSDDPRLVRVARSHLEAAAAAETRTSMIQDAATKVVDGVTYYRSGGEWVPAPEPVTQVGTPLRDAAVDPAEGDLGPYVRNVNNPDRDPHGPNMVNAEVGSLAYQHDVDEARNARGAQE